MIRVFGSRISYYTGKLETYLRYRSLDYRLLPTYRHLREIRAGAGAIQMPVVQLEDGRWMSDSTPMLAWLDAQQDAPSIYPEVPVLRFVALLLEDYADEWLWRPAMHYRWSYRWIAITRAGCSPTSRSRTAGFRASSSVSASRADSAAGSSAATA